MHPAYVRTLIAVSVSVRVISFTTSQHHMCVYPPRFCILAPFQSSTINKKQCTRLYILIESSLASGITATTQHQIRDTFPRLSATPFNLNNSTKHKTILVQNLLMKALLRLRAVSLLWLAMKCILEVVRTKLGCYRETNVVFQYSANFTNQLLRCKH